MLARWSVVLGHAALLRGDRLQRRGEQSRDGVSCRCDELRLLQSDLLNVMQVVASPSLLARRSAAQALTWANACASMGLSKWVFGFGFEPLQEEIPTGSEHDGPMPWMF